MNKVKFEYIFKLLFIDNCLCNCCLTYYYLYDSLFDLENYQSKINVYDKYYTQKKEETEYILDYQI